MTVIGCLSALSKYGANQRLHGLSGVRIDSLGFGWPLGDSKTRMESSTSKDTPFQISGAFGCHLPLLEPPFHLFFFLSFFFSDFATASSSSSASTTASSLASAQYLIWTNRVAILIRPLVCNL